MKKENVKQARTKEVPNVYLIARVYLHSGSLSHSIGRMNYETNPTLHL